MLRVIIESPLNAPSREEIEENKRYAKAAVLDSLRRGEAPYASHIFFDQAGLLDDLRPDERKLGMEAGFAWGAVADKVAVYIDKGISSGMASGIDLAASRGIPVEYRYLGQRGDWNR